MNRGATEPVTPCEQRDRRLQAWPDTTFRHTQRYGCLGSATARRALVDEQVKVLHHWADLNVDHLVDVRGFANDGFVAKRASAMETLGGMDVELLRRFETLTPMWLVARLPARLAPRWSLGRFPLDVPRRVGGRRARGVG